MFTCAGTEWVLPVYGDLRSNACSVQNHSIFSAFACMYALMRDLNRGTWLKNCSKYRHKTVELSTKKQLHLNVPELSETRLRRGTSLFTLKLCTLAITKPGYPLQVKGFGRLMHSCPLFTAQTTLSITTFHFNSLGVWQAKHMKDGGFF